MMKQFTFICALLFSMSGGVTAQEVMTDLSDRQVDIRYSFDGADLLLFGTVGLPDELRDKPYDIAVIVQGPPERVNVRQKEKFAGIWINHDVHLFDNVPGFYIVASNRPLAEIAPLDELNEAGVGYQSLTIEDDTHIEHADVFRKALVRGKEREDLYLNDSQGVKLLGGGLFRADFKLPANVPVGSFKVATFIYSDGKLIAHRSTPMDVEKKGFERAVYSYAHDHPLFYGLTAVLIALSAGWLAGLASRK